MMAFPFLTVLTVYTYIFYIYIIYVYQTGTVMFKKKKERKEKFVNKQIKPLLSRSGFQ